MICVRILNSLIIYFLASVILYGEESNPGQVESPVRAIFWYNAGVGGGFGWFVFRENYSPIWYAFETPSGEVSVAESFGDATPLNIFADIELNPLAIHIQPTDHGYAAKFRNEGKKISLSAIRPILMEQPNGAFAASAIVKNIDAIPKGINEARKYTLKKLKESVGKGDIVVSRPVAVP